jgi:hypothetical protein
MLISTNETQQNSFLAPTIIDFQWLTAQPLLPFIASNISPHLLYRSLLSQGFEDSLEVVEWIRGEQLQKVLDFDLWEKSRELDIEDVSAHKAFSWIQAWLSIDSTFAAERFLELEEETICLILSKLFEIIPEGINQISEDVRENWWLTPDNRFFLRIRENAEETFEVLKMFVDALYAHNIKLAGSVFAYSCMLVRQETLEEGLKWRSGRLADQGFVRPEEAREILSPKRLIDLKKTIQDARKREEEKQKAAKISSKSYLVSQENLVKPYIDSEEFGAISKMLNAMTPEEGCRFLVAGLGHSKVQIIAGSSNTSLEQMYTDEDFLNEATENIIVTVKNIMAQLEFRFAQEKSAHLLIEHALMKISEHDKQKLLSLKESIAHLSNCVSSIQLTNYSQQAITASILVTRGAINLGLELCLKTPEEYGLNLQSDDIVLKCVEILSTFGVDFLFHLGWNLLFTLERKLAEKIIDLDNNHSLCSGKLETTRTIHLSDGSTMKIGLDKLISNLRFADVSLWLNSKENLFSSELFFTLNALFTRIPHFPKTLSGASLFVDTSSKPFETLDDVDAVFSFIENLNSNIEKHINMEKTL